MGSPEITSREILQKPQLVNKRNSRHCMVYILLNGFVVIIILKLWFPIISWISQFLVQTTLDLPLEDTKAKAMFTSLLFSVPLRVPIFLFNSCSGSFFSTSLRWHQSSLMVVCSLSTRKMVLPPHPPMLRLLVYVSLKRKGWADRLTSCAALSCVCHMEGTEPTLNGTEWIINILLYYLASLSFSRFLRVVKL